MLLPARHQTPTPQPRSSASKTKPPKPTTPKHPVILNKVHPVILNEVKDPRLTCFLRVVHQARQGKASAPPHRHQVK